MASNALTYDSQATINQSHLARVRKGMSEKQVLQIMRKPYSYETFQVEDDVYDVWFYVTKPTGLDQTRMVAQNLTPLTFKNGILVGNGYTWYYYAMKAESMELEPQKPIPIEHHKKSTTEDEAFEKVLRAPGKPVNSHLTVPSHGQTPPTEADKAREPLHTDAHTHPAQPLKHTHPTTHPVKTEQKTPHQPQAQPQATPQHKPPENPDQENQKLPPNVHIISQAKPIYREAESEELSQIEKAQDSSKYCGKCPTNKCSPNRFQSLILGITETQVYRTFGNPNHHETFYEGHDAYDVWFYETYPSKTGKSSPNTPNLSLIHISEPTRPY